MPCVDVQQPGSPLRFTVGTSTVGSEVNNRGLFVQEVPANAGEIFKVAVSKFVTFPPVAAESAEARAARNIGSAAGHTNPTVSRQQSARTGRSTIQHAFAPTLSRATVALPRVVICCVICFMSNVIVVTASERSERSDNVRPSIRT